MNLVVNACDAMDSQPVDSRRLVVATAAEGSDAVRVTVADAGPGIKDDRLPHIFEPFVTSKPQRLGLGLAICSSIVSAHDGRLWAENQPDGGAAFHVVLPGAVSREPSPGAPSRVHAPD
jgi:C4-dicarboxylate-specific signal transduction histidine kinase